MALKTTQQDLVHKLTHKLNNLALSHFLPIQPALALLIFKDSFQAGKNMNAEVESHDLSQTMHICGAWYSKHDGRAFNSTTTLRYDEIFRGRGIFKYGSVGGLYGTSKNFFDQARLALPAGMRTPLWERLLNELHNEVASNINTNLGHAVSLRRENTFTDMSSKFSSETVGKLMEKVLAGYDLNLYERSVEVYADVPRSGQVVRPERLLDPWHKISSKDLPSPASFEEFFWGVYLFELSKAKKYPLNAETDDPFRLLVEQREEALQRLPYK
jgi:hypothetical protein